jgi:DNA-binding HxlR family transcriptional regulator
MEERGCCPYYHEAIELIGRRWTGAIVAVLMDEAPLRFTQIAHAVPDLSDRLLSARIKELEARGVVVKGEAGYELTPMGRELEPALDAIGDWARRWLTA